jgi:two-component system NtrC family sensor kinase
MAAVGSLAAAIGHEVINPIAAISGVAQFMRDEAQAGSADLAGTVREFSNQILAQTDRITTIMRQMANFTAAPSPEPELIDVNAVIRATCGFICYDKRFRDIEFDYDLRTDLPAVTAVADHVTQILMNLLINAADALEHSGTPGRRCIRVSTRVASDQLVITVHDNGPGMAPEVLARAFDESFTTKPAGKGRGIGLFVCKRLIEQAGGSITLESGPQVGTTATLLLPLPTTARRAA